MTDRPLDCPPAATARRRWGKPRRRALAYVAAAGAVATALTVQACSDTGPTGAAPAGAHATGRAPDGTAAAGGSAAGPLTAAATAWIGREHNRALQALLPEARAARATSPWTRAESCAYVARSAEAYIRAGRAVGADGQPIAWTSVPANSVRDGIRLAEVCTSRPGGATASFVEVAARAAREGRDGRDGPAAAGGELSPSTAGAPELSAQANELLAMMEWAIDYSVNLEQLGSALAAIEGQVQFLPTELDQVTVLSAASTARASANNVGLDLPPGVEVPAGGDGGVVYPMGNRARPVIKADVRGCVGGAIGGFFRGGGWVGAGVGCFAGGIGASFGEMMVV